MPRRLASNPVLQSRFLWRVYIGLAVVLCVAGLTMMTVFIWNMPQQEHADTYALFRSLGMACLVGLGVALAVGIWLTRSVRSGLEDVTQVAQALTCGDFNARVRRLRNDEFGLLGLTLNLLGEELTDRMALLSQERAQLQAMLAGMVEGIIAVGDDDRILFSNQAADRLLRTDVSGCRGARFHEISGLGVLLPMIIEARRNSDRIQKEINLGDGPSLATLEIKAAQFRGDHEGGVVIVLHDVTDLRRLERVRRDFVANVSHELKTPLTSVKGYLETLRAGAKDDPAVLERFLGKIDNNVVRLVALVQDILSLGSIEGSDGKLQSERVDWLTIIRQVLPHHELEMQRKKITLDTANLRSVHVIGDREA
ncbi:MAG: HAMP domain-containing protein, partial [Proteobacteria bacterium]|nr:HAMP domain-containing protein [Pseudomonadota bacterium]